MTPAGRYVLTPFLWEWTTISARRAGHSLDELVAVVASLERARRGLSNASDRAVADMILRDLYAAGVRFHRARDGFTKP